MTSQQGSDGTGLKCSYEGRFAKTVREVEMQPQQTNKTSEGNKQE